MVRFGQSRLQVCGHGDAQPDEELGATLGKMASAGEFQTTPGYLQPNIQLPVPTDVGVSCKDYSNKVPCLEESVLLTRIKRYFTETN